MAGVAIVRVAGGRVTEDMIRSVSLQDSCDVQLHLRRQVLVLHVRP